MNLLLKCSLITVLALVGPVVGSVELLVTLGQSKTLYFDKLSTLEFHQQIQTTVESAYEKLGYDIAYIEHPLKRSYAEATAGRLSGLMARVEQSDLNNLIKIPVALKTFKIVLIVNNKKCADCSLNTIQSLATVSGFKGLQKVLANKILSVDLFEVHNRLTLFRMFAAGRVDAIAVSEVLMIEEFLTQKDWRSYVIGEQVLYHYLHKEHAYLIPQITTALSEVIASNDIAIAMD